MLCAITPIASIEASNVSHANFPTVWLEQSQNGIRSRKLCLSKLSFDCNRGIATFILSKWALVCCLNEKRPSHFRLAVRCMEYFFCGQNQTFYRFYHCINGIWCLRAFDDVRMLCKCQKYVSFAWLPRAHTHTPDDVSILISHLNHIIKLCTFFVSSVYFVKRCREITA